MGVSAHPLRAATAPPLEGGQRCLRFLRPHQDLQMNSLKPYLIRAIYDWILDNSFTPFMLVDASIEGALVPEAFVEDGRIVLNLRPEAVKSLELGNDVITFSARFSGKPMQVHVPIRAVLALYAQENGRGMVFDEEESGDDTTPPPKSPVTEPPKARPALRVVK